MFEENKTRIRLKAEQVVSTKVKTGLRQTKIV